MWTHQQGWNLEVWHAPVMRIRWRIGIGLKWKRLTTAWSHLKWCSQLIDNKNQKSQMAGYAFLNSEASLEIKKSAASVHWIFLERGMRDGAIWLRKQDSKRTHVRKRVSTCGRNICAREVVPTHSPSYRFVSEILEIYRGPTMNEFGKGKWYSVSFLLVVVGRSLYWKKQRWEACSALQSLDKTRPLQDDESMFSIEWIRIQ